MRQNLKINWKKPIIQSKPVIKPKPILKKRRAVLPLRNLKAKGPIYWMGTPYTPGSEIPEEVYEGWIDKAYGCGEDLRKTKLWDPSYERGFVCPSEEGDWAAFAYVHDQCRYLGRFEEEDLFDEDTDEYDDEEDEYEESADLSDLPPGDAIEILWNSFLDTCRDKRSTEYRIATDPECIRWITDYWAYVQWNEHGNADLERDSFSSFIDEILHPEDTIDYLMPDGPEWADKEALELAARLRRLHDQYGDGA